MIESRAAGFPAAEQSTPRLKRTAATKPPLPLWLMIPFLLALGLVLAHGRALSVWQKGTFFDSDDAMRMVELRNFLHGQGWFDMTVSRLDPPHGVFMHWSRLVDLPLAALFKLFALILPVDLAERGARLAFPLLLQALLYLGMARLAKSLIGAAAVVPALVLTLLSGMEVSQFQPGRIHHSAPQITLTIFMLASFVEALDAEKARRAAITGALAALSLAISLESLPFIIALAGLAVAFWIWCGAEMRRMLAAFGLALLVALPAAYVATVAPARWLTTVCDAYSPAYLLPGLCGAVVMVGLALLSPRLPTKAARFAAGLAAGGLVLLAASAVKPICFVDPYHGIDPLLRKIWLDNVIEGFSLRRFFAQDPATATILVLPLLLGCAGTIAAVVRGTGLARLRWIGMTVIVLVAAGLSFWMIRMLSYASLSALLGGAWCVDALRRGLQRTKAKEAAALAFCLVLPFSTIGWALVIPAKGDSSDWNESRGCLASSAFAPLAKLPQGLVAAPIDAGSHILALTNLSVLAAPYHRDNSGNRSVLDAMLATPAEAHEILTARHVTYVMTCGGLKGEAEMLAKRAPHGLAATLIAGDPPAWLQALPKSGPYQVYVIH